MRLKIFLTTLAALTVSTTFALADAPRAAAQQCALQTHAPGNYNISNAPGLPHVLPGQGGTAAGAARINDCLTDVYQVQYGAKRGQAPTARTPAQTTAAALEECERIRNRNIGTGAVATVAVIAALGEPYSASVVGGAIGSYRGLQGVNKRYKDCVANATVAPVNPKDAIYIGCRRSVNGVMSRGTRLCVAP